MARGNTTIIEGNLTRDPELKFSANGNAICNIGVAWSQYKPDAEDIPHFFDVTVFGDMGENVASSMSRGDRVLVEARLDFSTWEDKDTGANRNKVSLVAEAVGPSLRWATAVTSKAGGNGNVKPAASSNPGPALPDDSF